MIAGRITTPVPGAPVQPGERVRVVAAIDASVYDVSEHVGAAGRVAYLNYDCGCGQSFPGDPMIGIDLDGGAQEEFWRDEIASEGGQS